MIEIEYRHLQPETLHNLLQEIILREGIDDSGSALSITEKISRLQAMLEAGKASIVFDAASGECGVIIKALKK